MEFADNAMAAGIKVLLVDDEAIIRNNLGSLLERSGFEVASASNGRQALDWLASKRPDIVVLDVLMPELGGREVLRQLRSRQDWLPVILLTNIGDSTERALAIEEGADDYINKPFDTHELIARIKGVLRRAQAGQPPLTAANRLLCAELVLDRSSRRAILKGRELILTPKAVTLLEYLMTHPGDLITRERLLDAVWGWDYPAGTRAVDTRVAELRKALGDDPESPHFIETVVGQGYRFIGAVERGE